MINVERLNFDLLIHRSGGGYRARVVRSPGGEADIAFALPEGRVDLERLLRGTTAGAPGAARDVAIGRAGRLRPTAMADLGRRLFRSVFVGPVGLCYARSLSAALGQGRGVRIRLRLTDVPELLDLPWELLYDPDRNGFVASSDQTALVRYLDLALPVEPLAVDGPLRVLVVVASPTDLRRLDVQAEWSRLTGSLSDLVAGGRVAVELLEAATLEDLRATLRRHRHHVLHYIGHGGFDHEAGQGFLALVGSDRSSARVMAEDVSDALAQSGALRLVVLNTCEGARGSVVDPFAGTAQSLVARGIPAVVAMQFEVSDIAAVEFARGFYTAVAAGTPVDDAVTQGRLAMMTRGDGSEWATPVLYTHAEDARIFALPPAEPAPAERGGMGLPGGGRVFAGDVAVRVDPATGVWVDPNPKPVAPRRRPGPVAVLPPPFPLLLGRDAELAVATGQPAGTMVRFTADAGWGKTALLRAWANRAVGSDPGGLLFLRVLTRPAMDVLQFLFEGLYETDVPFKPDDRQLAGWMAGIQAAVVLDDMQLTGEDVALLRRVAPQCRFVVASRSHVAGEGEKAVELAGVSQDTGVALVSLELGRTLRGAELDDARRLCDAVGGSPARILAGAERAWREDRPLGQIADEIVRSAAPADLASVGPDGRRVLGILAAFDPVPVHVSHLVAVAGLGDPLPVLESLQRARLVVAGSPMYTLAFPLSGAVRRELGADAWALPALEYLVRWGTQEATPHEVLRDADLLVTALGLGREVGRDADVLALGRAIEGPLIAGRRWGQWGAVLRIGLAAALAGGDVAAQAWASHQVGSRALALGDRTTAADQLSKAVRLRESIHDEVGLSTSRHNLAVATGHPPGPAGPTDGGGGGRRGGFRSRWGPWLASLGVVAVVVVLIWLVLLGGGAPPQPPVTPAPTMATATDTPPPPPATPPPATPLRSVAPSSIEFGAVTVRTQAVREVRVSNRGGGSILIEDVTLEPGVDSLVVGDGCAMATLGPGDSCLVELRFTPEADGPIRTELVIRDDTGGPAQRVPVQGEGVPEPEPALTVEPSVLDFGVQLVTAPEPARQTLIVANAGQADLHVRDVSSEGAQEFQVASEDCRGRAVAAGSSCSVTVIFEPTVRGRFDAQLTIDAADEGRQAIALVGAGATDRPDLRVLSFQPTGEARPGDGTVDVPVELVVYNDGDVPAAIFKVSVAYTSDSGGPYSVALTADGTPDVDSSFGYYPFSAHELEPDGEIVFTGVLRFADDGTARVTDVVATADSCSGDEFIDPAVCRVVEVREDNNTSTPPQRIDLPTFAAPTPSPGPPLLLTRPTRIAGGGGVSRTGLPARLVGTAHPAGPAPGASPRSPSGSTCG